MKVIASIVITAAILSACYRAKIPESPAEAVTAAEMTDDFERNEVGAAIRFKGKRVLVTGKILSVSGDDKFASVLLEGNGNLGVLCYMKLGTEPRVASWITGETVVLVGNFDERRDLLIKMRDCNVP